MWLLSAVNKNDNDERGVVCLGLVESTLFVLNFAILARQYLLIFYFLDLDKNTLQTLKIC